MLVQKDKEKIKQQMQVLVENNHEKTTYIRKPISFPLIGTFIKRQ